MTAMTHAGPTLRDFFALADDDQATQRVTALAASPALSTLAGTVSEAAGASHWQRAVRDLAGAIPALLHVDVSHILAGAWQQNSELGRFTDPHQYPPDETILVALTTHVVSSQHRPHLDLLVNDRSCGRLDVTVKIALRVEGVVLTIRDGKIWQATTGACTASGRIACADHTLSARASVSVRLPETLVFDRPVPIARHAAGWEETPLRS